MYNWRWTSLSDQDLIRHVIQFYTRLVQSSRAHLPVYTARQMDTSKKWETAIIPRLSKNAKIIFYYNMFWNNHTSTVDKVHLDYPKW